MATVNQPGGSKRPTNKLMTAAAVGPAAAEVWGNLLAGTSFDGPAMSALVGAIASLGVGYWIKDRPNVVPAATSQ